MKATFFYLLLFCLFAMGITAQAEVVRYTYNNDGNPIFKFIFYDPNETVPGENGVPNPYTEYVPYWEITKSQSDHDAIVRAANYWTEVLKPTGRVSQPVFITAIGDEGYYNAFAVPYLDPSNIRTMAYQVLINKTPYDQGIPQALVGIDLFEPILVDGRDLLFALNSNLTLPMNMESTFIHEIAHVLGIAGTEGEHVGDLKFDSFLDRTDGTRYFFTGPIAMGIYGDGTYKPVPMDEPGNTGQGSAHFGTHNTIMTHQLFSNYTAFVEVEMAALKDLGYDIDLRNFFGRSIYTDGNTITNNTGFYKSVGGIYQIGVPNISSYAIGLHIYGTHNTVTQNADLLANGPGSAGLRVDGTENTVTINPGKRVYADGDRGIGLLVSYGSNNVLVNRGNIEALGMDGDAVRFDIGMNFGDYDGLNADGYGKFAQFSYLALNTMSEQSAEFRVAAKDFLYGPLVSEFDLSGSLKGANSAIYISPNSHVKSINILDGARVSGAIITDYDDQWTAAANAGVADISTALNFGYLTGSDGRSLKVPDPNFNFSIIGAIWGYGAVPPRIGTVDNHRHYIGRGKFNLNFVGGRTYIDPSSDIRVNKFNVEAGAGILTSPTFDQNRFTTVYSNSFYLAPGSSVGLGDFSYGDILGSGSYPVLQLAFNETLGSFENFSLPDTSFPFYVGINRYSNYELYWGKESNSTEILRLSLGPNVVVKRDRELASDYAVAAPGALFASDPGWALLRDRFRTVFNDPVSSQDSPPAAGDPSFEEGLSNKLWAKPFYSWTTHKANDGSAGYNLKTFGLGLGYEHFLGENFMGGLALILSHPDYHSGGVKSEDQMLTVATYGLARLPGELELGLAFGHAKVDYSQKREVLGQFYASEYHSTALRAGATLARPIILNDSLTLKPRLSYDYLFVKTGGYSENNVGPLSIKVDGFNQKLRFLELGADLAWQSESGLMVKGSVGGTRLAGDRTARTAAVFQGDLARPFLATGDALDKNILNLGLGVSIPLGQSLSIKADYQGDFGKSTKGHSLDVALNFLF